MIQLTPEEIKAIKDKFNGWKQHDEKLKLAEIHNRENITELVNLVNDIFKRNHITETIDNTHIRFEAGFIGNILKVKDKKLSDIIFDTIYPKPALKLYSHYTTFNGACGILANKELWLFNLLKNFDDDEFKLFYEHHNMTGYRDMNSTLGIPTDYRSLMAEQFALCLTSATNNSLALWNFFGYQGTGIKLTFEIDNKIPDFREVYYSAKDKPERIELLADLFDTIARKYNSPFNFTYASKIGAFYIHGRFENEQEYRFLVKRTADNYNAWGFTPVVFQDDISYITLPFKSPLAEFKLKKVSKGPNCSLENFKIIKDIISANYTEQIEIED